MLSRHRWLEVTKLKAITFSSPNGTWYWHVLYDGDTVGNIGRYTDVWVFAWNTGEPYGRPDKFRDAILAAALEKETVLNIALRLTK